MPVPYSHNTGPMYLRSITALLLCVVLSACEASGPETQLDNYTARLANTLDTEVTPQARRGTPRLPRTGALRIAVPAGNLGALDFLALRGCALQVTIGKRNSSLGIHASDSQRLLLELEFLELAPECIAYMRANNKADIAATLQQAYTLKQTQLPALIFNATLANREFRAFWQKPAVIANYPAATSSLVVSALGRINGYITRWLAGDFRADNADFEVLLSEIAKGDGGALLLALSVQEAKLAAANHMLIERAEHRPLCAPHYRAAAAEVLPVVVRKYFIGEIQPWSATLDQRYRLLLPAVEHIEAQLLAALPAGYQQWRSRRTTILNEMPQAPANHVAAIQQALASCGSELGNPTRTAQENSHR